VFVGENDSPQEVRKTLFYKKNVDEKNNYNNNVFLRKLTLGNWSKKLMTCFERWVDDVKKIDDVF